MSQTSDVNPDIRCQSRHPMSVQTSDPCHRHPMSIQTPDVNPDIRPCHRHPTHVTDTRCQSRHPMSIQTSDPCHRPPIPVQTFDTSPDTRCQSRHPMSVQTPDPSPDLRRCPLSVDAPSVARFPPTADDQTTGFRKRILDFDGFLISTHRNMCTWGAVM